MPALNWNQHRFKKANEPLGQLEDFFKTFFEQQFKNAQVELIRIREPLPFEDEGYLRVTFVYSSTGGDLDDQGTLSFVRHILPKLQELNEDRFPVVSFVTYDDYLDNSPEGAVV